MPPAPRPRSGRSARGAAPFAPRPSPSVRAKKRSSSVAWLGRELEHERARVGQRARQLADRGLVRRAEHDPAGRRHRDVGDPRPAAGRPRARGRRRSSAAGSRSRPCAAAPRACPRRPSSRGRRSRRGCTAPPPRRGDGSRAGPSCRCRRGGGRAAACRACPPGRGRSRARRAAGAAGAAAARRRSRAAGACRASSRRPCPSRGRAARRCRGPRRCGPPRRRRRAPRTAPGCGAPVR